MFLDPSRGEATDPCPCGVPSAPSLYAEQQREHDKKQFREMEIVVLVSQAHIWAPYPGTTGRTPLRIVPRTTMSYRELERPIGWIPRWSHSQLGRHAWEIA